MKGFIALRSFKHGKLYKAGDQVDINEYVNKRLEMKGLIRWVERPVIIMPKDTPKKKRNVRKSKKDV